MFSEKGPSPVCQLCGEYPGHKPDCETGAEIVSAKTEAIVSQSPKLSADVVQQTAEAEVATGKSIEAAIETPVGYFEIQGEDRETMDRWKDDITAILDSLREGMASGDLSRLVEITEGAFHEGDIRKIYSKVEAQAKEAGVEFGEEAEILLAIGLWLWKEQGGEWKSGKTELKSMMRMLMGEAQVGDALDPEHNPNCVETTYLIQAVAREMGVQGRVQTIKQKIVDHRFFETDSGKVVDYWWMRGTAGLAMSKDIFLQARPEAAEHGHK